jgi:hypothetical protein
MIYVTVYIVWTISYPGKIFVKFTTGVSITKTFFLVNTALDKIDIYSDIPSPIFEGKAWSPTLECFFSFSLAIYRLTRKKACKGLTL